MIVWLEREMKIEGSRFIFIVSYKEYAALSSKKTVAIWRWEAEEGE